VLFRARDSLGVSSSIFLIEASIILSNVRLRASRARLGLESRRHARQRRNPIKLSIRKDRLKFDKGFGRKYGYLCGDSVRFAGESSEENRKSPRTRGDNLRKVARRLFVNAENSVSVTRNRQSAIVIASDAQ